MKSMALKQNGISKYLGSLRYLKQYITQILFIFLCGMWLVPIQAVAGCPELSDNPINNDLTRVNQTTDSDRQTIYFCKQNFSDSSLTYAPSETELYSGDNVISVNTPNPIQTFPISNSVTLTGFNPSALNLNDLNGLLPNTNGQFNSPSLYNFYTRQNIYRYLSSNAIRGRCNQEYTRINNYLANNASFQASSVGIQTSTSDLANGNIAKINNAKLTNNTGKVINADIEFYHANADQTGQYFSRPIQGRPFRRYLYCWVGVGSRISLNSNTANITESGDYDVTIGVITQ